MSGTGRRGKANATATLTPSRYEELKRMLSERRSDILNDVQDKIRTVRAEGADKEYELRDHGDFEVGSQNDIELALIRMKVETLNNINQALRRLEEGTYGRCYECGAEIAAARLRAIPFAVRCKHCEEDREMAGKAAAVSRATGYRTPGATWEPFNE